MQIYLSAIQQAAAAINAACASFFMVNNVAATIIGGVAPVKIAGVTVPGPVIQGFNLPVANQFQYTQAGPDSFLVTVSADVSATVPADIAAIVIMKNGTAAGATIGTITAASPFVRTFSSSFIISLVLNDIVEMFIVNRTAPNNLTVENMNATISQVLT